MEIDKAEINVWINTMSTTTIENDEVIPIAPGSTLSKEGEDSAGLPIPKEVLLEGVVL